VGIAVAGAGAAHTSSSKAVKSVKGHSGIVEVSQYLDRKSRVPVQVNQNKAVSLKQLVRQAKKAQAKETRAQKLRRTRSFHAVSPAVGTERTWLALDDSAGFYRKRFTLRGVSNHTRSRDRSTASPRSARTSRRPTAATALARRSRTTR
jgi:hypothetical protein